MWVRLWMLGFGPTRGRRSNSPNSCTASPNTINVTGRSSATQGHRPNTPNGLWLIINDLYVLLCCFPYNIPSNMERNSIEKHESNQLHPYEYLTELNAIYSSCNKANAKSFSSVSTLKLAWKPFSIIKIPNVHSHIFVVFLNYIREFASQCEDKQLRNTGGHGGLRA